MLVRRRYYTWLIKAYIKRWKRTIFYSVIGGIVIFFLSIALFTYYLQPLVMKKVQRIGYAGFYSIRNLPDGIQKDISYGLTNVDATGQVRAAAASSWQISNKGKDFTFKIKPGQLYHNGQELTAENINLNFKDAKKTIIDTYTVRYSLDTPYSPFITAVTKPLYIKNLTGLGKYKIRKIELNADFFKTITLQDNHNATLKKIIYFYPTTDALKTAFALGEIDSMEGLPDAKLADKTDFSSWKNVSISKMTNTNALVAAFYNNSDNELSNKKLRQALDYAAPESFTQGKRAYSPIPENSIYFSRPPNYGITDMEIAKEVLKSSQASLSKPIIIYTTNDFVEVAKIMSNRWSQLGVKTTIKTITNISELPANFQVLIYQIKLPKDPDQYTLWHSDQPNNIGHFKNLRIDKLLEDGRVEFNSDKRKTIYADFQKYLIDDVPASFLYFPYEYSIARR